MRRVSLAAFVAFWAGTIGWLAVHAGEETKPSAPARTDAGVDAAAAPSSAANATTLELDAGLGLGGGSASPESEPPLVDLMPEEDVTGEDGGTLPSLSEAPKSLTFGVILVQYSGAQGAAANARSRAEATEIAKQLAEMAKTDFAAAVAKGDPGSTENAGRMFRTILEPDAEAALFTLEKGAVSEPVDTPRGFWILKRIE
jgi:PPIC-type peptidyl-prolyl cis-trans isomerase-like protein